MLKLKDFARECGVTDRAIQKHLKNNEEELQGHFERRGSNGTWLDEYAQEFIRSKMKQQPIVVGDNAQLREMARLNEKIERLQQYIDNKDMFIAKLLDDANAKQERLQQLEYDRLQIEARTKLELKQQEDALTLRYRGEIEQIKQELDNEKKRPLTLKERLTGHK